MGAGESSLPISRACVAGTLCCRVQLVGEQNSEFKTRHAKIRQLHGTSKKKEKKDQFNFYIMPKAVVVDGEVEKDKYQISKASFPLGRRFPVATMVSQDSVETTSTSTPDQQFQARYCVSLGIGPEFCPKDVNHKSDESLSQTVHF